MIEHTIKSTAAPVKWVLNLAEPLHKKDIDFIKDFSPIIYHNDLECYLWAFDTKLPSGRWLENMRFSNDLKTATALIL